MFTVSMMAHFADCKISDYLIIIKRGKYSFSVARSVKKVNKVAVINTGRCMHINFKVSQQQVKNTLIYIAILMIKQTFKCINTTLVFKLSKNHIAVTNSKLSCNLLVLLNLAEEFPDRCHSHTYQHFIRRSY